MKFLHRFQRTSAVSFKTRTRRHLGLTRTLFVHTVNCPLDGHLQDRPWLSVSERCSVERKSGYRNTNNFTAEPFSHGIHVCLACTKQLKLEYCALEKLNYVLTVQLNVHYKQTITAAWSKSVTVLILRTGARLQNIKHFAIYCHVEQLNFCFEVFSLHKTLPSCPSMSSRVSVVCVWEVSVL